MEVDESVWVRRKYNRGRMPVQQWVLGGVCRETNACFLFAVDDRTQQTLHEAIKETILPGSRIITDCFPSYNGLSDLPGYNYTHETLIALRILLTQRLEHIQIQWRGCGVLRRRATRRNGASTKA